MREICYTTFVMEKRIHFYVSRKNALTWLMALCLVCSAVTRIVIAGVKGSGDTLYVWSQIILPVAATLLYLLIALLDGKEHFYKTAIPVWMVAFYLAFAVTNYGFSNMVVALYWIVLFFFALVYREITAGRASKAWALFFLFALPLAALLYLNRKALLAQQWDIAVVILPDVLLFLGWILLVFAIRFHPLGEYHPTWGDRSDGRRIRSLPPMAQVVPYIMVTRNTSTNYYPEAFEISNLDR